MEERHFDYKSKTSEPIVMDKNASKDFINSEMAKTDNLSHQEPVETPNKSSQQNNDAQSKESKDVIICPESVNSGLESDIEDNDSDAHPTADLPQIKEPDPDIDNNLPSTVTLLRTPDGGKCYVIGTAHFSIESQNDVSKVIQAVQPHIVMVELCASRVHVLQLDEETVLKEAKNLTFNKMMDTIQQNGVSKGLFHILLLNMSAHLTKVLGLAPGGEFRRAFKEAKTIPNCLIHMGDRPIKVTFTRAMSSLSWWQSIKLAYRLLTEKEPLSQEDVEKYKSRDSLDQMMAELAQEFPPLEKVFVKERDIYLTHSLQLACRARVGMNGRPEPARVVGVVGMGHTIGIIEHWGKVKKSDIPPIMSVPPPSLSSKVLKFTVKATLLGTVVYVGYKLIPVPVYLLQTIKSSVEGLTKKKSSNNKKKQNKTVVSMEAKSRPDEYEHPTLDIMYVVSNIPGPGCRSEDFNEEFSIGCTCDLYCKENCTCTNGIRNYIDHDKPIVECNSNCSCVENCGNRIVQQGPLDSLIIKETNTTKGLGLFTTKLIKKGQFICEYAGEVIGIDEAERRFEENKIKKLMNYVLVVSEFIGVKKITTCIDPAKFGNIGRYCNHSCQPNAILVPVRINITIPRLCLFAIKNIEPMDEICFNYAGNDVAYTVQNFSETPCLCSQPNCLGLLPHCSLSN